MVLCPVLLAVPQTGDVLYSGGDILTMRGEAPEMVEALVSREGRIAFVGTLRQAEQQLVGDAKRVNLAGKTLVPGFIDGHSHLLSHADGYTQAKLSPPPMGKVSSIDELVQQLQLLQAERKLGPGEWIVGSGYDQNFLKEARHPTADELDKAFPNNPVVAIHSSGHMLVANSLAFAKVGIDSSTVDPEGGMILRRPGSQVPAGLVQEMAMAVFSDFANPARELQVDLALIRKAVDHYASFGITTAAEHLVMPQKMPVIRAAAEQGLFPIDVVATPVFTMTEQLVADPKFQWRRYHKGLKFGGIKVAVDGSPQGKTAFVTKPYFTRSEGSNIENRGFANIAQADLESLFALAYRHGVQVYAHCNGDAAIDMVIQAHRSVMSGLNQPAYDHRTVIVHSQIMRPDQLTTYQELKLYPTFFTNHVYYWGETHRANLGEDRARFISPLQSARLKGVKASNHTDNAVTPVDPLFLLWTSVARETRTGDVLGAAERVTPYDGLKALTADAAYEYFEETEKGTLEIGKLADLVILDANPIKVSPNAIKSIQVLETIKAGKVVYKRGDR